MKKELFDRVSFLCSKVVTKKYSTSFSLGILALSKELRNPIYAIYGFVRYADEIVDSFHGFDKKTLLDTFKKDTYTAINTGISLNPVLNAFQHVVHQYKIEQSHIDTFLASMYMDLDNKEYNQEGYSAYILGSAEVVGLMCLHVFTQGNNVVYNELKPFAMSLGAAFQKVNFLRDVREDYLHLGRNYFPGISFTSLSQPQKEQIESEIEKDFHKALIGIKKLPRSSRGGVYLAYVYYLSLFKKIKNLPPHVILMKRVRVNNAQKLTLMINSVLSHKMKLI